MYFYCTVYKICQTYRNATVIKTLKRAKSTATNVIKSKSADIIVSNQLIHEYVWEHLDNWYDKTAVVSCVFNLSTSTTRPLLDVF
jgi:hypothetical protein